ncbi:MAG: glycoside hydrolase family 25 protein [Flavobacterium sp.]|nr:glycoside hydrolase family 25 protein [Flavobacterium sp.]
MSSITGIDVSHYQGNIDWVKVDANAKPISFVYIKATEGSNIVDPMAAVNGEGAAGAGIRTGYYHFANPQGAAGDAAAEAKHFISVLQTIAPPTLKYPYALDIETNSDNLSPAAYLQWVYDFIAAFKAYSNIPLVIYSDSSFLSANLATPNNLGNNPLWIARYSSQQPVVPAPWTKWSAWQYSDSGVVSGISGSVDMDTADSGFL